MRGPKERAECGGGDVQGDLLKAAASNPYRALRLVLGGPLHPGGRGATDELLDRADVGRGDRVLDLGCGRGQTVVNARERGARAWGIDERDPGAHVLARMESLPIQEAALDVVLSECALCLAEDLDSALAEVRRVLEEGGRLAFSDVTVDRPLPEVPRAIAEPLCLTGRRDREHVLERLAAHGFDLLDVRDHHEALLQMRSRLRARIDVEGLLEALDERGDRLQAAVDAIEDALEAGEIGYLSIVARRA